MTKTLSTIGPIEQNPEVYLDIIARNESRFTPEAICRGGAVLYRLHHDQTIAAEAKLRALGHTLPTIDRVAERRRHMRIAFHHFLTLARNVEKNDEARRLTRTWLEITLQECAMALPAEEYIELAAEAKIILHPTTQDASRQSDRIAAE